MERNAGSPECHAFHERDAVDRIMNEDQKRHRQECEKRRQDLDRCQPAPVFAPPLIAAKTTGHGRSHGMPSEKRGQHQRERVRPHDHQHQPRGTRGREQADDSHRLALPRDDDLARQERCDHLSHDQQNH